MRVKTLQENLLRSLIRAGRILSSKPQLPVAQSVLLQTKEGRLQVATTNLETTELVWVGARVEQDGGACVSARLFTELVLTLPPETVELRLIEGALSVSCAGFRASLPTTPAGEFPPVLLPSGKEGDKLEKKELLAALSLVLFAAATDEGRPMLTGARFLTGQKETTITATDGYRLSLKKIALTTKQPLDAVIPARALAEVVKAGAEEKTATDLRFVRAEGGQLAFSVGDTEIITRSIDGQYPNTEKIIPSRFTTRALFEKDALLRAVKSASVFARDNANIVNMIIKNQTATITAQSAQAGKNEVEISGKIDGEGGEIAFNSRFLLEFLSNFSEPEVLFEMTGSLNPGVFRPVKDDSYLHIIMPVRTQG